MNLVSITRYPIKGFAGEQVPTTAVHQYKTLPGDRQYALQYADRIPPKEGWRPKKYFLQSVHTNLCSLISIDWDDDTFTCRYQDTTIQLARHPIDTSEFSRWITSLEPSLGEFTLERLDSGFTDEPDAYVSLVNQNTIVAIAEATSTPAYAERYRANLLIEDVQAFGELDWVGKTLIIGSQRFEVVEPIVRCRATECDWHGGRTDDFLQRLDQALNLDTCGLFLKALDNGTITDSDAIEIID